VIPTPIEIEQADPGGVSWNAEAVVGVVVDVHVEPELVGVERLRPVDVGHGDEDDLEGPVHGVLSLVRGPADDGAPEEVTVSGE